MKFSSTTMNLALLVACCASLWASKALAFGKTGLYYCGDGAVDLADEECDDGNAVNGDGCNTSCKIERHQLPASAGFADNSADAGCFQRDWNNPGRVNYDGCAGATDWWDLPMPTTYNGTKNFGVYLKSHLSGNECYAEVLDTNGSLPRWDYQTFDAIEGWVNFASLSVTSGETAEIQCTVATGSGDYISAVRGF